MAEPVDLYALPPEQFTSAREAAAKAARADGDRERARALKALRRPSVAAHLVNLLVRREPELIDQLLALGQQLGDAQREGSGDALRTLGEQRRALVAAVTGQAVNLAGRDVTAAVRVEVENTLEAALADPASAEAVRSGRLVRALSYAGFGGADLTDAVAPEDAGGPARGQAAPEPAAPEQAAPEQAAPEQAAQEQAAQEQAAQERAEQRAAAARRAEHRRAVQQAERVAQEAAGRFDDAVRGCDRQHRDRDRARRAADEAAADVAAAEHALTEARERHAAATRQVDAAEASAEHALDVVRDAQADVEAARAALDALRRAD